MSVKLLTEHHLEFLTLNGSSESTLVKRPHCWKSHVAAYIRSLFRHVVCDAPVSCKANGDRNQLGRG